MSNLPSQFHSVDSVDIAPISSLIALIRARCNPLSVWLFGSRAKGSPREDSDWDLLVVLPDDVSDEQMFADNPPSKFGRMTNVNADIVYCNETEFFESTSVPNTLAYEVARTGVEIAGGRLKEPPASEEFERLADCVDVALKEVAKRFEVAVADKNKPAGNADPIR